MRVKQNAARGYIDFANRRLAFVGERNDTIVNSDVGVK